MSLYYFLFCFWGEKTRDLHILMPHRRAGISKQNWCRNACSRIKLRQVSTKHRRSCSSHVYRIVYKAKRPIILLNHTHFHAMIQLYSSQCLDLECTYFSPFCNDKTWKTFFLHNTAILYTYTTFISRMKIFLLKTRQ